jgi:hypothetical protein
LISSGGNNGPGRTRSTTAAITFYPEIVPDGKISVFYNVVSQEFPQFTHGPYNDTIAFGFAGSNESQHFNTISMLHEENFFKWAYDAVDLSYEWQDVSYEIADPDYPWVQLGTIFYSDDAVSILSLGFDKNWGGITLGANEQQKKIHQTTIYIPDELLKEERVTLIISVNDVGDLAMDTAFLLHRIQF